MLVTPTTAREQYKQGKPFKATFEEFLIRLFFYSEMLFKYNNKTHEAFLMSKKDSQSDEDYNFIFCCEGFNQEYKSREKFKNKANINGILLKDMWDKIEKP